MTIHHHGLPITPEVRLLDLAGKHVCISFATKRDAQVEIYLRLMPASGGIPRNIAYVYGGQGTINVPSWSPDSKRIAFVSNTQLK